MKKPLSDDKLRGGYYTPAPIARFLAQWAIRSRSDSVLEPSCGDGHILSAAADRLAELGADHASLRDRIFGVELLEAEARKAAECGAAVATGDFFAVFGDCVEKGGRRFSCAVGNPPFIRYQNFDPASRDIAFSQLRQRGFSPNKLTNAWIPFLVLSAYALAPNGRLAMVIPAELLQVDYAGETRRFIASFFKRTTIVLFRRIVFDGIQQEVILLLCEKDSAAAGIRTVEVANADELAAVLSRMEAAETQPCLPDGQKWTRFLLSCEENNLLDRLAANRDIASANDLFEVNVGLVSGENDFFVLSRSAVDAWRLGDAVRPIVSRAEQVRGLVFGGEDFKAMSDTGKRVHLFDPGAAPFEELPQPIRDYIAYGERQKFNENYKCRIRTPWYRIPESWVADAFLTRQVNAAPRMILNGAGALVTDTLHKIRFHDPSLGPQIVCAFLNSYTFALSETLGRSYGGGVMTFEPGEVRKMRIPMAGADKVDIKRLDALVRAGDMEAVLDETDRCLLLAGLGLSQSDIRLLRGIWGKLRDRRFDRKSRQDDLSFMAGPCQTSATARLKRKSFAYSHPVPEQLLLAMEKHECYYVKHVPKSPRTKKRSPQGKALKKGKQP